LGQAYFKTSGQLNAGCSAPSIFVIASRQSFRPFALFVMLFLAPGTIAAKWRDGLSTLHSANLRFLGQGNRYQVEQNRYPYLTLQPSSTGLDQSSMVQAVCCCGEHRFAL
jgi:hypothetical protein